MLTEARVMNYIYNHKRKKLNKEQILSLKMFVKITSTVKRFSLSHVHIYDCKINAYLHSCQERQ